MHFVIRNKIFQFFLTFWTWGIFYPLTDNITEKYVLLLMHLVSLINLYLLEFTIKKYVINHFKLNTKTPIKKFRIFFLLIFKFFVLVGGILFGIHLIGNKIIIGVINYILLIFTIGVFAIFNQKGDT